MRKSQRRKRGQSLRRQMKRTIRRKRSKRSKRKRQKLKSKKKSSAKKGGMYSDIPTQTKPLIFAKVRLAMAFALSNKGLIGDVIEMVNDRLTLGGMYQGITIIFMSATGAKHEITLPRTLSSSLVRMKHLKDILKENFVKKNVELRLVDTDTCKCVSDNDETLISPGKKVIFFQEVSNEMKNSAQQMEADCENRKLGRKLE